MGGCKCTYRNCQNTTKTTENVHFFHYPIKQKERCVAWIKNANKPEYFILEADQLKNKVICEQHFEEIWFSNCQKKRLLPGAIPTLDGDSYEQNEIATKSKFLSDASVYPASGLDNDIRILPGSDDGTIFFLDTDAIYDNTQAVESYTYDNGLLVPSDLKRAKLDIKSNSWQQESVDQHSKNVTNFDSTVLTQTFQHISESQKSLKNIEDTLIQTDAIKKEDLPGYSEDVYNNSSRGCPSPFEQLQTNHFTVLPELKSLDKSSSIPSQKEVNYNYLSKIEQHSREIESIKQILKSHASNSKPNQNNALKLLQNQLPQTLFTILNLCLKNNYEFTDHDIEFFTTLHKISPEAYQLLKDKYQWPLPCVNIVESYSNE